MKTLKSRGEGSSFQAVFSGCKTVRCCGQSCQKLHWSSHKGLCPAIEHLETQKRLRVERGDGCVFASHFGTQATCSSS